MIRPVGIGFQGGFQGRGRSRRSGQGLERMSPTISTFVAAILFRLPPEFAVLVGLGSQIQELESTEGWPFDGLRANGGGSAGVDHANVISRGA